MTVTVPRSTTGFSTSNSDPKEWCAGAGAAVSSTAKTASPRAVRLGMWALLLSILFLAFRGVLVGFFFRARTGQVVREAVIRFVACVLVDRPLVAHER